MRRMRHLKPREIQGCDIAYDFSNATTLYDATSGGSLVAADGAIARVEDVSGNARHATQSTSGSRPTRKVAARNGVDAARFDGTADYLTAGDVADILAAPVEVFTVSIRTGGGTGLVGIFGKSKAASADGRWSMLIEYTDRLLVRSNVEAAQYASSASASTALQLQHGYNHRTVGASAARTFYRRNGAATASGSAYTETSATHNTTFPVVLGAYQDSSTDATGIIAGSYFTGDICECAKYSVAMTDAQRLRLEHSRMRKWRISG